MKDAAFGPKESNLVELRARPVGASVVNQDDFATGKFLFQDTPELAAHVRDVPLFVEERDNHGKRWPISHVTNPGDLA